MTKRKNLNLAKKPMTKFFDPPKKCSKIGEKFLHASLSENRWVPTEAEKFFLFRQPGLYMVLDTQKGKIILQMELELQN